MPGHFLFSRFLNLYSTPCILHLCFLLRMLLDLRSVNLAYKFFTFNQVFFAYLLYCLFLLQTSDTHEKMIEILSKTGFVTQEFILSPIQFGVPYSRPRYFCLVNAVSLITIMIVIIIIFSI